VRWDFKEWGMGRGHNLRGSKMKKEGGGISSEEAL